LLWNAARTARSWGCAACTTSSRIPMTSTWPGGWPGSNWGHGYATEAATGWLDHGFGALRLPRVISMTDPPNLRSLAVMRRLGMVFDHEAEIEDMGVVFQAVVYAITREQWRGAR
jgi:RimJ/RimL family protein N-acetyltransferase